MTRLVLVAALAALTAPALAAQQKPALNDPTIVAIFDYANTQDIQTGSLAAKRAHAADVKSFGAMLAHDHRQVRQMGRDLAKKLGVTPTPPADFAATRKAQAATMRKLEGLHGEAFDKAFLKHEVDFHQAVRDAISSTLLPAIQNDSLRALVVKVAPAFKGHQEAAEALEKKHGYN